MSVAIDVKEDDIGAIADRLKALAKVGRRPALMRSIAAALRSETIGRFSAQKAPDGSAWKPVLGKPKALIDTGVLRQSIVGQSDAATARVGSNLIYAAIHQFGGTIKPKSKKALKLPVGESSWVTVKKAVIPPRPYLGVSVEDERRITRLVGRYVARALS